MFIFIADSHHTDVSRKRPSLSQKQETRDFNKAIQSNDMMEHYKKRYIHQLEKPETVTLEVSTTSCEKSGKSVTKNDNKSFNGKSNKKNNSSTYQASPNNESDKYSDTSKSSGQGRSDKRKTVKVPRRKSVSRAQFRHDAIQIFIPGQGIY